MLGDDDSPGGAGTTRQWKEYKMTLLLSGGRQRTALGRLVARLGTEIAALQRRRRQRLALDQLLRLDDDRLRDLGFNRFDILAALRSGRPPR